MRYIIKWCANIKLLLNSGEWIIIITCVFGMPVKKMCPSM